MNYHFHSDGTFTFEPEKEMNPKMKNAMINYIIKDNNVTVSYDKSTIQESKIIKLTATELEMQSKDSIIIVYQKLIK